MHPKKVFALWYCAVVFSLLSLGGWWVCETVVIPWWNQPSYTSGDIYEMERSAKRRLMATDASVSEIADTLAALPFTKEGR